MNNVVGSMNVANPRGAGVYPNISDRDYFTHPALSQSQAKLLLPPSTPAHFMAARSAPARTSTEFDIGHAAHLKALGCGPHIVHVPVDDWRSKAAQDQATQIRAEGGVPLKTTDYEMVEAMAEALLKNSAAAELLTDPTLNPEVTLIAQDDVTGVWIRGKADLMGGQRLVDYKTTSKPATVTQFAKTVWDYGYDLQAAWYQTLAQLLGVPCRRMVFIVQEKTPPYLCALYTLDDTFTERGLSRMREALDTYLVCSRTEEWPGYVDSVTTVRPPPWATPTVGVIDTDLLNELEYFTTTTI